MSCYVLHGWIVQMQKQQLKWYARVIGFYILAGIKYMANELPKKDPWPRLFNNYIIRGDLRTCGICYLAREQHCDN